MAAGARSRARDRIPEAEATRNAQTMRIGPGSIASDRGRNARPRRTVTRGYAWRIEGAGASIPTPGAPHRAPSGFLLASPLHILLLGGKTLGITTLRPAQKLAAQLGLRGAAIRGARRVVVIKLFAAGSLVRHDAERGHAAAISEDPHATGRVGKRRAVRSSGTNTPTFPMMPVARRPSPRLPHARRRRVPSTLDDPHRPFWPYSAHAALPQRRRRPRPIPRVASQLCRWSDVTRPTRRRGLPA
jgi:hypothetical protein